MFVYLSESPCAWRLLYADAPICPCHKKLISVRSTRRSVGSEPTAWLSANMLGSSNAVTLSEMGREIVVVDVDGVSKT